MTKKSSKRVTRRVNAPKQTKRSLFVEIENGLLALKEHREGRITLREHTVRPLVLPTVDGRFIEAVRNARGMSRAVFAHKLGLSPRSLERWEQELSAPPVAVAALILMAAKFPDTFDRLASLEQPTPSNARPDVVIRP